MRSIITLLILLVMASTCLAQGDLRTICWNLEGNGKAELSFIEKSLEEKDGVQLWGLVEVKEEQVDSIRQAIGKDESGSFKSILGTSGDKIRLLIVYDDNKLELIGSEELTNGFDDLADASRQRIPLVAHFKVKVTGQEFKFVVIHLNRGDNRLRHQQASTLRKWAVEQKVPVIMGGDFNLDFHIFNGDSGSRDRGFDNITEGGLVKWLRPVSLVKTEDSNRFMTVLDFFFYANEPIGWSGSSRILDREGDRVATTIDFDDDDITPDHRPIDAILQFNSSPVVTRTNDAVVTRQPELTTRNERIDQLLKKLKSMEDELKSLRTSLEELH